MTQPDGLSAALEEIRQRLDGECRPDENDHIFIVQTWRDARRLVALADAVLKIHYCRQRADAPRVAICGRCHEPWPCREAEAVSRALGIAETRTEGESAHA